MKKLAIVTGGSRGIGPVIGRALAAQFHIVFVQRGEATEAVASIRDTGGTADSLSANLNNRDNVAAFFAAFDAKFGTGRLFGLVNNAGICPRTAVADTTQAEYDEVSGVNLQGPMWMAQMALPRMWQSGGGSMVHIGSVAGLDGGNNCSMVYSATKMALVGMSHHLAKNGVDPVTKALVRSNVLAPGPTVTEMMATMDPTVVTNMANASLTKTLSTPEHVATGVAFLLSNCNVSGAVVQVGANIRW